ncbi:MAG: FecR family protein, partial [Gammaproteobacteria bacterium]
MSTPPNDPVQAQAFFWLARVHSGEWSEGEDRAFWTWLAESEAHRVAYEEAEGFWQRLEPFESLSFPELEAAERYRPPRPARRARLFLRIGLASMLSLLLAAVFYGVLPLPTTEVYHTAKGEHSTVTLAEGSTVELGADTEMRVTLSRRARSVRFLRGEALFTVVHDPARPFEVHAGEGRIRDLGTVFDVSRDGDRVSVTVVEGEVGVILGAAEIPHHLDAGQRLSYRGTGAVAGFGRANLEAVTAWRTGKLLFEDQPLERVLSQFSRYHDIEFTVADPALAALRVSGVFQARNLPLL